MLLKIVVALLLAAVFTRVFLRAQWKGLGLWLSRCVDLALVVLAIIYIAQLLVITLH